MSPNQSSTDPTKTVNFSADGAVEGETLQSSKNISKNKLSNTGNSKSSITKKILLFLLLILILGGVGVGVLWAKSEYLTPRTITQLMPAKTQVHLDINTDYNSLQHQQLKSLLSRFPYFDKLSEMIKEEINKGTDGEDEKLLSILKQIKQVSLGIVFPSKIEDGLPGVLIFGQIDSPKEFLEAFQEMGTDDEELINSKEDIVTYKGFDIYCLKPTEKENNSNVLMDQGLGISQALPISQEVPWEEISKQSLCLVYFPKFEVFGMGNGQENMKESIDLALWRNNLVRSLSREGRSLFDKKEYKETIENWQGDYLLRGYYGDMTELINLASQTVAQQFSSWKHLAGENSKLLSVIDEAANQYFVFKQIALNSIDNIKEQNPKINQTESLLASLFSLTNAKEDDLKTNLPPASGFVIQANDEGIEVNSIQLDRQKKDEVFFGKESSLAKLLGEKVDDKWISFYFERASIKEDYNNLMNSFLMVAQEEEHIQDFKDNIELFFETTNEYLGVDFEKEILGELDENYTVLIAPSFIGEMPVVGAVFNLKSPDNFKNTVAKIEKTFSENGDYCYDVEKKNPFYQYSGGEEMITSNTCLPRKIEKQENMYVISQGLFPAYLALEQDKLLIASSKEAIKDILKVEKKNELMENKDFQNQFSQLPNSNLKSISYTYVAGFWGLAKSALSMYNMSDQGALLETEKIARAYLGVLKTIGSYNYFNDGNLIKRLFFKIDELPPVEKQEVESLIQRTVIEGPQNRAMDARRVSDLRQIELALELYYAGNQQYPSSDSNLTAYEKLIEEGYLGMSEVPTDPKTGNIYCYAWGRKNDSEHKYPYQYYHIGAKLSDSNSSMLNQDVDFESSRNDGKIIWKTESDEAYCPGSGDGIGFNGSNDVADSMYDRKVVY